MKAFWIFSLSLLLAGCYGRINDSATGRKIDSKAFGLDGERPALIVFGAVWCKPCLSEIKSLNRALQELNGKVQVSAFVVEGAQKGVLASPKDKDLFIGPGGVKPQYQIASGTSWDLFDQLQPPSGRALPTLIFVDRGQEIVKVVQRSMEYETELLPLLKSIASGETIQQPDPKPEEPLPPGDPDAGKFANMNFSAWTKLAGNDSTSTVYNNFHEAWLHGLKDYTFMEDDMPFESAKMKVFLFDDGRNKPVTAVWTASLTGCKLTVYLKPDGTYEKSEGICK